MFVFKLCWHILQFIQVLNYVLYCDYRSNGMDKHLLCFFFWCCLWINTTDNFYCFQFRSYRGWIAPSWAYQEAVLEGGPGLHLCFQVSDFSSCIGLLLWFLSSPFLFECTVCCMHSLWKYIQDCSNMYISGFFVHGEWHLNKYFSTLWLN
jgi:hypothetical protein